MRIEKSTKNFKKLIEISIRLDNILYNKIIKKIYNNLHKRFEIYAKKNFSEKNFYFENKKQHLLKITFMKLNTITQRKKINFKKKRNNNKTCYLCNKLNYFARNCRNKVIQRRQFNVILKKKSNTKKKK